MDTITPSLSLKISVAIIFLFLEPSTVQSIRQNDGCKRDKQERLVPGQRRADKGQKLRTKFSDLPCMAAGHRPRTVEK